jgi:hypothetical protein
MCVHHRLVLLLSKPSEVCVLVLWMRGEDDFAVVVWICVAAVDCRRYLDLLLLGFAGVVRPLLMCVPGVVGCRCCTRSLSHVVRHSSSSSSPHVAMVTLRKTFCRSKQSKTRSSMAGLRSPSALTTRTTRINYKHLHTRRCGPVYSFSLRLQSTTTQITRSCRDLTLSLT